MGKKALKKKRYILLASFVLLVVLGNLARFSYPVYKSHYDDSRNEGIFLVSYYNYLAIPNSIVVDLWHVSSDKSMADVSRYLLQLAEALKDREFDKVYIAYKGERKFYFRGDYFQNLGAEYGFQNPAYTLRTLPENVYTMDGQNAFGTWEGGLIGVLGKQMEDLQEFHKGWYLND